MQMDAERVGRADMEQRIPDGDNTSIVDRLAEREGAGGEPGVRRIEDFEAMFC
jgi:hypothetical protein